MQTENKTKSFAFKLAADTKQKADKQQPWQVRDGVAVAGCSGPYFRESLLFPYRRDAGEYC